jgi:processive 1,2-diacylglycerol beta-glucosyltransferase
MPQRWLILTSSTGSGHDTRAYALRDWARASPAGEVRAEVWHVLEETSAVGALGVGVYNRIQRHWPGLHQVYWHVAEGWNHLNEAWLAKGGKRFARRLEQDRPHLVISMHDSLNAAYFRAARRVLGPEKVRCATYCGEWSAGYGFSRHWIDREVDLFAARTPEVRDEAIRRGIPAERLLVFRNLLRQGDFGPLLGPPRVRAFRRDALGLEPERFTLLLASGALGADRHHRMLTALLPMADRVQAIALCGRNEPARRRVEEWVRRHPRLRVSVQGYTDAMPHLFQAANAVLTRGGSNTLAECLHFERPILFHAEGGIMPQEYCTRRFLERHGIGLRVPSAKSLRTVLEGWLDDPSAHAAVAARLAALREAEQPDLLVERLRALASEVT